MLPEYFQLQRHFPWAYIGSLVDFSSFELITQHATERRMRFNRDIYLVAMGLTCFSKQGSNKTNNPRKKQSR